MVSESSIFDVSKGAASLQAAATQCVCLCRCATRIKCLCAFTLFSWSISLLVHAARLYWVFSEGLCVCAYHGGTDEVVWCACGVAGARAGNGPTAEGVRSALDIAECEEHWRVLFEEDMRNTFQNKHLHAAASPPPGLRESLPLHLVPAGGSTSERRVRG